MRGKRAKTREIEEDPLYHSLLVAELVNRVMKGGKKSLARKIVYGALEGISEDREEAVRVLEKAVENVAPRMEVRPRKVGGASYQVPYPVSGERGTTLAIRWLVLAAQNKKGGSMKKFLEEEIRAASKGEGDAVGKRKEIERIAEANRAFSHLRW